MSKVFQSGEIFAASPLGDAQALCRACHEMVDAASALILNVEFLAEATEGRKQQAAEDARHSVDRIVKVAKALRDAAASRLDSSGSSRRTNEDEAMEDSVG
jgi:hypothetical protein